jgi:erythritol kinase (D-erythritol 1-phosphate-forming)
MNLRTVKDEKMALLCIDVGTTMVKAVIFDEEGHEVKIARQGTVVIRTLPGHSEQDMYAVWDAVVFAVQTAVHQFQDIISSVSITGQGDGCWLVDEEGKPTGPAVLWNDARAKSIVEEWDSGGLLEALYKINGNQAFPGTSSAILQWFHDNDQERLERSYKALYCTGWIYLRLTGQFSVDETDAASPYLDLEAGEYSTKIQELLNQNWVFRLLPKVKRDGSRVEPLLENVAAEMRLSPGIPVVLGPFDIPITAIGIGATEPNQACTILGTTLSTDIILDRFNPQSPVAGMTLPSGVPGTFTKSLAAMAGVEIVTWCMNLMNLTEPDELSIVANEADPGSKGLLFFPFMSPAGERAPFLDVQARGSLHGLTFEHGRPEIARAILEGMSYSIRHCLNFGSIKITELRLSGGGANSEFWCQLLADITEVPTMRSVDSELGAKGAFLVAQVELGRSLNMTQAVEKFVHVRDVFQPIPENVVKYQSFFSTYLALLERQREQWPILSAIEHQPIREGR